VRLAARGTRKVSGVEEAIEDGAELEQVRAQANRVKIEATLSAAGLTALALLVPRGRTC